MFCWSCFLRCRQADLSAPFFKKNRKKEKKGIHALCAPQLPQSHFSCGWTNQVHNYSANQSGVQLWLWGSQILSRESCQQSKAKHLNLPTSKRQARHLCLIRRVKQRKISSIRYKDKKDKAAENIQSVKTGWPGKERQKFRLVEDQGVGCWSTEWSLSITSKQT